MPVRKAPAWESQGRAPNDARRRRAAAAAATRRAGVAVREASSVRRASRPEMKAVARRRSAGSLGRPLPTRDDDCASEGKHR